MPARQRLRHVLLVAGAALWLAAFALPSARWENLGHPRTDPGYVVARDSFQFLGGQLSHWKPLSWQAYILMFAGVANLLVPAFCFGRGALPRTAVVLGLLLAWYPAVTGLRPNLCIGFYTWAAGLTLLGCGSWLAPQWPRNPDLGDHAVEPEEWLPRE
ncbi:MAG TPA: hypothetical protein VJA16_07125 [Thermoanaerobaculia bacterium]